MARPLFTFSTLVGVLESCEFLRLQRVGGRCILLNGKASELSVPSTMSWPLDGKVLEVVVRRSLSVLPFCLFLPSYGLGCLTFPPGVYIADENLLLVSPSLCWLVGKTCREFPSTAALRWILCVSPGLLRRIVF